MSEIEKVVSRLDRIVDWARDARTRLGYFAALYRDVTEELHQRIGRSYFDNDHRLTGLLLAFSARYFRVIEHVQAGETVPNKAWAGAIAASERDDLVVIQQLLSSMNPHINIDLALACADVCPDAAALDALRADFDRVNDVLVGMFPLMERRMGPLSPVLHRLDEVDWTTLTPLLAFSMSRARESAWELAGKLISSSPEQRADILAHHDERIAALGELIVRPLDGLIATIAAQEETDVVRVIDALRGPPHDDRLPAPGLPPNEVYYFYVAPGRWTGGTFSFEVVDWWGWLEAPIGLKNRLLVLAMAAFQRLFGHATADSTMTPVVDERFVRNEYRIRKSWLTLFTASETYRLDDDGRGVRIQAKVRFGPIPWLFREKDAYTAQISDGGHRATYDMKLLSTGWIGRYRVITDDEWYRVNATLEVDGGWARVTEQLARRRGNSAKELWSR